MTMGIFREWIQNIVIFLLLMTMAGQLIPDDKYRKYIRLTMGLLLIMVILLPIGRLTGLDKRVYENFIQESLNLAAADAQAGNQLFDEDTMFVESYTRTVTKEIEAYFDGESMIMEYCEMDMDKDSSSEDYGKINAMRIGLVTKDGASGLAEKKAAGEAIQVERIIIGTSGRAEGTVASVPKEKQEEWLENLSLQFGIDKEQIELEILS